MAVSRPQCLFAGFILFLTCYYSTESAWRTDRRPKFMGDKVHHINTSKKIVQQLITFYHNQYRRKVNPPAANMLYMNWNRQAAYHAAKWAAKCMLLTHDRRRGRYTSDYGSCGQNIFIATSKVPWHFAIETWYLEKEDFRYGAKDNNLTLVGHYTQLAWAATHQLGCAVRECHRNGVQPMRAYHLYVCNYCPIGNKPNRLGRPYKKGAACASCPHHCHRKSWCNNACRTADRWANCRILHRRFPAWLCHTTNTLEGRQRRRSCRATCGCQGKVHD